MSGLDVFQLVLGGPGIYFTGQSVYGHVIVHTSEVLYNIKSVQVKIKGKGEVNWTEKVSTNYVSCIYAKEMGILIDILVDLFQPSCNRL